MASESADRPPLEGRDRWLRRVFDRRAASFERSEFLPREVSQRMLERLEYIVAAPTRVLDAGCGTGRDLGALSVRYPQADVFGLDLSHAMAASASARLAEGPGGARRGARSSVSRWLPEALRRVLTHAPTSAVQANFAQLPFATDSIDLLWSNLALQWHARPDAVFPEWQRVLKPGGLLMFSTLGPDTLLELRAAYQEIDPAYVPIADFVDMHDFGDMLVASAFEVPVMDMERLSVTYRTPEALLADVRQWGAFLGRDGVPRPQGLGRRARHRALLAALERQRRDDGTIALTFELIYGHAWCSQSQSRQTDKDGHAVVRIDQIGRGRPKR